jgi:hypothetical protein
MQRQITNFPYVELSDVPRLQQVEREKRRTAEESRTKLCVLDVAIKNYDYRNVSWEMICI